MKSLARSALRSRLPLLLGLVLSLLGACAVSPDRASGATPRAAAPGACVLRLGVVQWLRKSRDEEERIVPPVYSNHLPKSLVYECLVQCDERGRIVPGLARAWMVSADSRRYEFDLRPGARFHDGSPCDAAAVKRYFESWLVRPEDRFIGACERIESVEAPDARTVVFRLREPYSLLADLPLMNPMGIVGGSFARGGPWPMIGTGPFRVLEFQAMQRTLYAPYTTHDICFGPGRPLIEWKVLIAGADRDPVSTWALERGHVDALLESWRPSIPRDLALELQEQGKATLVRGPGAMVQMLVLNPARPAFADPDRRRSLREALDRQALIETVESGMGRPCATLFDPQLEDWPDEPSPTASAPHARPPGRVRAELPVADTDPAQVRLAMELARQLAPAGIDVEIVPLTPSALARRLEEGGWDARIDRTWGSPYDPHASLYARFGGMSADAPSTRLAFSLDPQIVSLVRASLAVQPGPERAALYMRIQERIDADATVLPLYIPDRIALLGPEVEGLSLGPSVYGVDLSALRFRAAR